MQLEEYSDELLEYISLLRNKRRKLLDEETILDERKRLLFIQSLSNYYVSKSETVKTDLASHGNSIRSGPTQLSPEPSIHVKSYSDPLNKELKRLISTSKLDSQESVWSTISGQIIPVVHRYRNFMMNNKRTALSSVCHAAVTVRESFAAKIQTGSNVRVSIKAKKASREMIMFWKKHEKEERELRKKAERDALEKLKQEEEEREKRRQAKKLQFLLTQTELYSHFVGNKLSKEAQIDNASKLSPSISNLAGSNIDFDEISEQDLQTLAKQKAQQALEDQVAKTKSFDKSVKASSFRDAEAVFSQTISQPKMLTCQLKPYQLKGINWLANLYEQGINGILADDMGLGKTVQSISLLAHLAETHNIWGPFLIVSPASTLHNWQQEFVKFTPQLKAIPYWGNIKDRKTLRKFWSGNRLYSKDSPFHVVITSYQIVVTDQQYFQRIKWQYMILDEAHAIKSSSSARWKTLLNFNCRNRVLLTGTPIQNSMAELWALLHFIMPTIFDSHEEFSEWFSKDIETHAVDKEKGKLNERQLKRLHSILKPFMLRRVKSDVEHELGTKIEKTIYCELTPRQKKMYNALDNTGMEELFEKLDQDESLMNMVMQFRKGILLFSRARPIYFVVCNHPQIFELAETQSPYIFGGEASLSFPELVTYRLCNPIFFKLPKLIWENIRDSRIFGRYPLIWAPTWVVNSKTMSFAHSLNYNCADLLKIYRRSLAENSILEYNRRKMLFKQIAHEDFHSKKIQLEFLMTKLYCMGQLFDLKSSETLHSRLRWVIEKVKSPVITIICSSMSFDISSNAHNRVLEGALFNLPQLFPRKFSNLQNITTYVSVLPYPRSCGFSDIHVPNAKQLLFESGKLQKLDELLVQLKAENHRVLIYFQMTKMIDLMEEYLTYRKYTYLRLDGSSKISDRRDMVSDWQTRPDLFIFLLSTRAGGLGINLTAADTVIFYDSDWNPTVDQQAMDRAHRLGQTKQVTVYRLITRGTIEERILERALQKDEIQKVVISDGAFSK